MRMKTLAAIWRLWPGAEYPIGVAIVFVLALAWAAWAP